MGGANEVGCAGGVIRGSKMTGKESRRGSKRTHRGLFSAQDPGLQMQDPTVEEELAEA